MYKNHCDESKNLPEFSKTWSEVGSRKVHILAPDSGAVRDFVISFIRSLSQQHWHFRIQTMSALRAEEVWIDCHDFALVFSIFIKQACSELSWLTSGELGESNFWALVAVLSSVIAMHRIGCQRAWRWIAWWLLGCECLWRQKRQLRWFHIRRRDCFAR